MLVPNVIAQQVAAEVTVGISPDRVDVVHVVLRVVVLDEKRGRLEPVVVRAAPLGLSRPGEVDGVNPGPVNALPLDGRKRFGQPVDVDIDQL